MQGIKGGIPAADHSRQLMQLALAANKLVGDSFSKEVEAQLATGQQAEEPREAQSRKRPRPKGNHGERDRHTWGSWKDDTWGSRRKEDENRKRDRKHDGKRDRK